MKKILLSLFWIITLWLNFWYCQNCNFNDIYDNDYIIQTFNYTDNSISNYNFYCAFVQFNIDWNIYYSNISFEYWWYAFNPSMLNWSFNNWLVKQLFLCDSSSERSFHIRDLQINWNVNVWVITIKEIPVDFFEDHYWYDVSCPDCPSCSECESELSTCQSDLNSCQNSSSCDYSWYILESEINSWYCLVNWLCPSSEICNDSDYSNLFIYSNNKYFPITWTNNIYVNLPSYLWYDYDYSNAWNDLDIDVWMVVDEDYIDWLNAVQNYKPTSEDFTKLIWTLAPYSKILIFCVFLFIIWAWIKKPFKSKKL